MKALGKWIEQWIRKVLLSLLRVLARSRRSLPAPADINTSKILFIRQDRIGDVLISTPLFASLKNRFPHVVLDVLLSTNNHFVLANSRLVRKRWIYTKRLVSSFKTLMGIRRERYDFVVDLMDNPSATSTVILLLSGGKRTVGLKKENAYACDIVVPLKSRKESHIVDRIAQLLTVFGIDPIQEELRIQYDVSESSENEVKGFLKAQGLDSSPLIGLNISAGSETRFWGIMNYRALLDAIRTEHPGATVVVLSKPSDSARAKDIVNGKEGVILAPETSFDGFAAWIKRVSLLVTPDTSAVHLAAAFNVPSVVLYVQSNPELRIWEPYKTPSESLISTVDDLTTISVDQVRLAVQRLLHRDDLPRVLQNHVTPDSR
ncbi:MAG: glycosyltransferase family 9 protein [Bacteroidota bacterium]